MNVPILSYFVLNNSVLISIEFKFLITMEQEKSIIFFTGNGRQIEVTRDKMKSISDRLWGIGEKENITNDSKSNKENERDFYNLSEDDDDIYDELIQIEIVLFVFY